MSYPWPDTFLSSDFHKVEFTNDEQFTAITVTRWTNIDSTNIDSRWFLGTVKHFCTRSKMFTVLYDDEVTSVDINCFLT